MRLLVLLVALLGLSSAANALKWEEFKARYNKQYRSPAEETLRHAIYQRNLASIELHNSLGERSFERGISHLSDLSRAEYLRLNALRPPKVVPRFEAASFPWELLGPNEEPPAAVDWSKMAERVGPVKNQGHCGSCWSFATTGLLEGQEFRRVNRSQVEPLSEQELIDCDEVDEGCGGGWPSSALEFIKEAGGLKTEHDYPYLSGQSGDDTYECLFEPSEAEPSTKHIKEFHMLPQGDEQFLKRVVASYGPVAIAFDASQPDFHDYKSGVYYNEHCKRGLEELDHAVLLVGYGTCPQHGDYWLLKNSWSEEWGERGYFKLARNRANHCGVATAATIVTV